MTPEQREALEWNYCGPYASTIFPAMQVRAALEEIKRLEGVIAIAHDEWNTCNAVLEATKEDLEVARRDVGDLLRAAGLGDHARPISTHQVVQAVLLPRIVQLAAQK